VRRGACTRVVLPTALIGDAWGGDQHCDAEEEG
jgi:hypothetical protein